MHPGVARCPNCGSTFHISRRQLDSAGGLARCGACLGIFSATENLVDVDRESAAAESVFITRAPEEYVAVHTATAGAETNTAPAPQSAGMSGEVEDMQEVSPTNRGEAEDQAPAPPEFENPAKVLPEDGRAALRALRPELELRAGRTIRWGAAAGKTLLCALLLALLAGQYLWRQLPVYSQVDALRPGYARFCAWVGCELPAYIRASSIRNDNVALQSHPDYPDAYLLAASFHNAAPFPQPFPMVVLRFTSFDARTVAMREFAPAEYLRPELLALGLMPPNAPVQIELEVMNPGIEAVGYQVSFRAP